MSSDPTPEEPTEDSPVEESVSEDPVPDDLTGEAASACAYTEYVEGDERNEYPATGEDATGVEADVWDVLYDIDDPEMPVSIVDLGLIYGVDVGAPEEPRGAGEPGGVHVTVEMTLTYTGCPARKYLTEEIEESVAAVDGVDSVDLDLVWSPPWTMEMVTDDGKEQLREFGLSV